MRLIAKLLILGLSSAPVAAQTPPERARALRDAGDLAGAATVLEAWLSAHPDDAGAHALLGATRYWMKDFDGAVAAYRTALAADSTDDAIRLDFGRMLVELQRGPAAREVLEPLARRRDGSGAAALYLLATLDYWSGDLTRARAGFRAVLAAESDHAGAAAGLREIRAASSPWLRIDPQGGRDTQRMSRAGAAASAGVFLTPLVTVDLQSSVLRYAWSDSTTTVARVELGVRQRLAGLRTTVEVGAGAAHWSFAGATRLTGRGSFAVDLTRHMTLHGSVARSPYVNTTASLSRALAPDRFELRLAFDHAPGWLGEAAVRRERFGDGNHVDAAWGWLIAPIVSGPGADVGLGWQIGWQDAAVSRYQPVAVAAGVGGSALFTGRYVPYYTPERVLTHGPAGTVTVRLGRTVTLSGNASYGQYGREDAISFIAADTVPGSAPAAIPHRRSFDPLEARGSMQIAPSARAAIVVEVSHARTSFYDETRARAGLVLRFLPAGS